MKSRIVKALIFGIMFTTLTLVFSIPRQKIPDEGRNRAPDSLGTCGLTCHDGSALGPYRYGLPVTVIDRSEPWSWGGVTSGSAYPASDISNLNFLVDVIFWTLVGYILVGLGTKFARRKLA
jgi:hypothetical protein